MSGQSSYQHDPYQRSPHPPASEFKSSYDDDLIDDYATPYSANSKHQVFTLPKSPTSKTHHRVHSIPHSSKGTILSKSDETHDSAFSYPPPLPQKDEPALTLWQKVSFLSESLTTSHGLFRSSQNPLHVGSILLPSL